MISRQGRAAPRRPRRVLTPRSSALSAGIRPPRFRNTAFRPCRERRRPGPAAGGVVPGLGRSEDDLSAVAGAAVGEPAPAGTPAGAWVHAAPAASWLLQDGVPLYDV